jgi:hypothetical protein
MTDAQRKKLTKALVECWLRVLMKSPTRMAEQVAEWLVFGRDGYVEMSNEELIEVAEDCWGWEELGLFKEDFK